MIVRVCDEVRDLLVEKNKRYGNSATDPIRIFSRSSSEEQLRVRIDDKLSRLSRGTALDDEDTVLDLIGYLILLRVSKELAVRSLM